jgi:two-component system, cell cycle sensor histidine kinase and response regulator CckA
MLKSLFQAIPVSIIVVDADRIIRKVNDYNFVIFGYEPDEVIGRNPRFFYFTEEDYNQAGAALHATSASMTEVKMKRKDGTPIWALVNRSPLYIEDEPAGEVVAALNITARKALEEQLRQSQKMEAIGKLAGGVAHDFNNILQAIMGYTQMVIYTLDQDDKNRSKLLEAYKGGQRAAELIQQLLAFSRRQVLKLGPLDLNQAIVDLMKMLRRLISENIELVIVPGRELWVVNADRGQIEQVLMNLCLNARDAMAEGGRLSIETHNTRLSEEFCVTHKWAKPGMFVRLSITDSGCGMDEQTREKIFEPFFTTKDPDKGTGLGLSTVYGIVHQHDGMIDVFSEPGKGSSFSVYLPAFETSFAEEPLLEPEELVMGGYETILLAEDNKQSRLLISELLMNNGYNVLMAADGEKALRLYHEHAAEIDLLLLDVVMPKKSGRIVYDEIRAIHPDIKCIFLSGYSADSIHTNFIADQGFSLIQKPFNNAELLRSLRRELDRTYN